jgi:hypothetical protein
MKSNVKVRVTRVRRGVYRLGRFRIERSHRDASGNHDGSLWHVYDEVVEADGSADGYCQTYATKWEAVGAITAVSEQDRLRKIGC